MVQTRSPGRLMLTGHRGTAPPTRPATGDTRDDGQVSVQNASGLSSLPNPREGILPVGDSTSDEFVVRLAAWLADVAMNRQGAT